jgi:hypothetical protein
MEFTIEFTDPEIMAKQLIPKLINHDSIMIQLRNKSWKPECVLSFNMG